MRPTMIVLVAVTAFATAGATRTPRLRVPADNLMSTAKVELGRRLFYDADLSIDGTMACATCHEQHRGFADGNRVHPGVHGDTARRNVPGLANVAWLKSYTWGDPRIRTLEAQVLVPVLGTAPVEMGMNGQEAEISRRLGQDACYRTMFATAFPGVSNPIDMPHVAMALAAFERTMVSFASPYDLGVALSPEARAGRRIFSQKCAGCHSGPLFTDGKFHRIMPSAANDRGLGEVTNKARDDGRFRTPPLRNVAATAPYFHDGSAPTLADAIDRHPGRRPSATREKLVAFLRSLTDKAFLQDERLSLPSQTCGRPL